MQSSMNVSGCGNCRERERERESEREEGEGGREINIKSFHYEVRKC